MGRRIIIAAAMLALMLSAIACGRTVAPSTSAAPPEGNLSCVNQTARMLVRGNSLGGVVDSGSVVRVMYGYYACNDVGRDDLVIVSNAGNPAPLIKIAKGIPGDTFRMDPKDDAWHYLVINGRNATNSRGEQYLIDERGYALLSLYYNDDKGVMPPDTYLLLGNIATGTFDSTRFGLIGRADILGKAIVVQNATNDAATDAVPEPAAGAGQFFPGMS